MYALLALISFFLMIYWKQLISGATGPMFTIFSPNDRYLIVDDLTFFFRSLENVVTATNFGEKLPNDLYFSHWHSETDNDITIWMSSYSLHRVKIWMTDTLSVCQRTCNVNVEQQE